MFKRKPHSRPLILGHRGASAHYPENTIAAFWGAVEAKADGVELDVRLCRSGELVVFHDEEVSRLCGQPGIVSSLSWRQLSELKVSGEAIPLLSQVLHALPDAIINVELKTHPLPLALPLVRATVSAIRSAGATERVLLSSFDPRLLALLRTLAPELPRGLLFCKGQSLPMRRAWLARSLGASALHPGRELVTGHRLHKWHNAGFQVNTWTVDDPIEIRHLARLGVDAIISNDPGQALRALSEGL